MNQGQMYSGNYVGAKAVNIMRADLPTTISLQDLEVPAYISDMNFITPSAIPTPATTTTTTTTDAQTSKPSSYSANMEGMTTSATLAAATPTIYRTTSISDPSAAAQMPTPPDEISNVLPSLQIPGLDDFCGDSNLLLDFPDPLQEENERLKDQIKALEAENTKIKDDNVRTSNMCHYLHEKYSELNNARKGDQAKAINMCDMANRAMTTVKQLEQQCMMWQKAYKVLQLQHSACSQPKSMLQTRTPRPGAMPQMPVQQQVPISQPMLMPQIPRPQQMPPSQSKATPHVPHLQQMSRLHPMPMPSTPRQQQIPAPQPKPMPQPLGQRQANPSIQQPQAQPVPEPQRAPSPAQIPRCRKQIGTWMKSRATDGLRNALYPNSKEIKSMSITDRAVNVGVMKMGKRNANDEAGERPEKKAKQIVQENVEELTAADIPDEDAAALEALFAED